MECQSFAVINTITDVGPLLVVGFGAWQVIGGHLSVGALAAFIAYLDRLYGSFKKTGQLINDINTKHGVDGPNVPAL